MLAESVLGEGLLPGLQAATFSPCPPLMVESDGGLLSLEGH